VSLLTSFPGKRQFVFGTGTAIISRTNRLSPDGDARNKAVRRKRTIK
jgi:hypothetical protein